MSHLAKALGLRLELLARASRQPAPSGLPACCHCLYLPPKSPHIHLGPSPGACLSRSQTKMTPPISAHVPAPVLRNDPGRDQRYSPSTGENLNFIQGDPWHYRKGTVRPREAQGKATQPVSGHSEGGLPGLPASHTAASPSGQHGTPCVQDAVPRIPSPAPRAGSRGSG